MTLRSFFFRVVTWRLEPPDRRVQRHHEMLNNENVKIHSQISNLLWRNNMPVRMIELEEATMVEISDESLESVVGEFMCNATGGEMFSC